MASITKEQVVDVLNTIIDKERGRSMWQMGLVTHLAIDLDNNISITVEPTNPACPIGLKMAYDAKVALISMADVGKVDVKIIGHKHADEMNKMLVDLEDQS